MWIPLSYPAIHRVLTNPSYAGAYVYGRTRRERRVDDEGRVRTKARHLERSDWQVLIVDHHPGYIDWATYEANQMRISANTRPRAHVPGSGALREGTALLQGLATCGRCGRRLAVHYQGANSTPGYHCANRTLVNGRGVWCLSVGGVQIDHAVSATFLAALAPAGAAASVAAAEMLEADHDAALDQWRRQVERARYEANRAERRYLAVDPDNRRGSSVVRSEHHRPRSQGAAANLVEEVRVDVHREDKGAELTVRWRGGATTELSVALPRANPPTVRTDEDTIALLRRLAAHYPDATIAGILNRQGRRSATGQRFTATIVQGLRHSWKIPRHRRSTRRRARHAG